MLMNKEIIETKMGDFDSNINKFLFFYHILIMMLKARGKVVTPGDKITTILRVFLMVKGKVL